MHTIDSLNFDRAAFYTVGDDFECLSHASPEDAILAEIDEGDWTPESDGTLEVTAWAPDVPDADDFAESALRYTLEAFAEDFGDPDESPDECECSAEAKKARAKAREAITEYVRALEVNRCHSVGTRVYSAAELRSIYAAARTGAP